jgi:uroporphyrinogen decarboxylase
MILLVLIILLLVVSHALVKVDRPVRAGFAAQGEHNLMVRALRGEEVERPPVWLMRQAGRYMADFRRYSEKYPFRHRSETPEIAIELSLQPFHSFGTDAVIMFSDILTPLPALGIEYGIVPGKGPKIDNVIRNRDDVAALKPMHDVDTQVPFLKPILSSLRSELEGKSTLIGFIGAPFTLAAYSVEGGHAKFCPNMKKMCFEDPQLAHMLLDKYTEALCVYASYQIENGAQVLQIFESWAHHLGEEQWLEFAKPYANRVAVYLQERHPGVPLTYFANGGSVYLSAQNDMAVDGLAVDWKIDMASARKVVGADRVLIGNVDPMSLYGNEEAIRRQVTSCIGKAGRKHVLNLGHGVEKDTPEENVCIFVDQCKKSFY